MGFMSKLAGAFGGAKGGGPSNPNSPAAMSGLSKLGQPRPMPLPNQPLQGLGPPPQAMPNPQMQQGPPMGQPMQQMGGLGAHLQGLGQPRPMPMPMPQQQMPQPVPHLGPAPGMPPQALPPPPMPAPAPQPSAMNPLNLPNPLKPPTSGKQLGKQLVQPFQHPVKTAKKILMPWK